MGSKAGMCHASARRVTGLRVARLVGAWGFEMELIVADKSTLLQEQKGLLSAGTT